MLRFAICILLLAWGGLVHADEIEYRLTIAPNVMEELNRIIRMDGDHHYACLTGSIEKKGAVVTGLVTGMYEPKYEPKQEGFSKTVNLLGACPINSSGGGPTTIATWHTHQRSCALSGTSESSPQGGDIFYSLQRPWFPFMVVQTDPGRWCWLHREQVLDLLKKNREIGKELKDIPFLAPPDRQYSRGTPN